MESRIKVIIADDHPLIRSAMRLVLAETADIEVVGEAQNGLEAIEYARRTPAHVVLLDVSMPGMRVGEVVQAIQQGVPALKIVIVSAYDDVAMVQALVNLGIVGYLLKEETEASLVQMIRTVYRGATWFSARVMEVLLASVPKSGTPDYPLTEREVDVLEALATGVGNNEIALRFGLAAQTVRNYTSRIYEKLEIGSRAEAIIWVLEHGLPPRPSVPSALRPPDGVIGIFRE